MSFEHKITTVSDLMEISLAVFITLDGNYCVYEGTTKELIFNWVHPLFLKDNYTSILRRITPTGTSELMVPLPVNTGNLCALNLKPLKVWDLGVLFIMSMT